MFDDKMKDMDEKLLNFKSRCTPALICQPGRYTNAHDRVACSSSLAENDLMQVNRSMVSTQ